jgi:hypothetical protein
MKFIDGTSGPGEEREREIVAIEPTERDGEVAAIRAYSDEPPVLQGRLILKLLRGHSRTLVQASVGRQGVVTFLERSDL